ncbi:NAD(P)/FAD-dependent oxidoreductase [Anabaena sp. UHCC 0399]|uniref:NAD(P)/FAD-dependent oxidoreductase n=1 Tax=Anabaena sp. UHCC 0399 TaxID=3110238 RepID=UPI002B212B9A|nr:FAD-dependent monooxygenase [Anabaena sp. UHCC 0399]MEA5568506.1 FAD-dependent monooxygenase [Anabaena sp. UHCC 0399]
MYTTESLEYDVVIMGAGFAGLCQARHLMLQIPGIRVALVDPRPEERSDKDSKIGESTIEIAALFLAKELGLHEYLIENHTPKLGLSFHWPKDPAQTENLDDYFHIWSNRQPAIPAFQINRVKFERDLLQMNKKMGAFFYNGRVLDVDLTPKDAIKTVSIKVGNEQMELKAKHIIDAAGRKFIIGRKTDNVIFGSENMMGLDIGSAWMRVKNVDRTVFDSGYDPLNSSISHYYSTNHYFGHGHWLWMIPIDTELKELSIGIIHHHQELPSEIVGTKEKFQQFIHDNHKILGKIIDSGELVDFNYWPKVSHRSKTLFSPDNWYVIGDAAYMFDAFYSYGTTTIALAIESVTEIIRAQLAGEADVEQKRSAYNEFNLGYARSVNCLYVSHAQQLGHASVMSWRVYFEYMWWFGVQVPMYVGKWHLDLTFIPIYLKTLNANVDGLFADLYQQFNQLVEQNANIGLMDCYRSDQLINDYYTAKHFDDFLENSKLEPRRCNVFGSLKATCFYVAIWYFMFQWKGFGIQGLLKPRNIYHFLRLLALSGQAAIGELVYKFKTRGLPANTEVEEMRQEFRQSYQFRPELQPWMTEKTTKTTAKEADVNQILEVARLR